MDAMPDKEITLVIYGNDSFIGTVECLVKNALGMTDAGNTADEGLVSMVYRLGKEEMPAKNIMVAARPRRERDMSLFSNTEQKGFLRASEGIIRGKARKLVCIVSEDTKLVDIYKALGFYVVATTIDDIDLMREYHGERFVLDYLQCHSSLRHVFMVKGKASEDGISIFADYWKAKEYVQELSC